MSRRKFVKYVAAAGGSAALTALVGGYLTGFIRPISRVERPWEVAPGVVDYAKVSIPERGSRVVLRIAQWFDYWPPTFLDNSDWSFRAYMQREFGIDVQYQIDYFTSNEELFLWISPLQKKEYDVFFPSNYYVELFNNAGWVYDLNPEWLPNLTYIDPKLQNAPADKPFDRRPDGSLISWPYFWGTTGIGFRTQDANGNPLLDTAFIEDLGWDVFLESTYAGQALNRRMNLLEDQRDVLTTGFKGAGWEWQEAQAMTPTGDIPPQWTSNETDPPRVSAARDYLFRVRPNIFNFDSTTVITGLQTGNTWITQAWSGDAVIANSPDTVNSFPVEYAVPKQGTTWWVDAMSVHSKSTNLWVAHQFMNYIHEPAVMRNLAQWNKYSCANLESLRLLDEIVYPNGYNLARDPRLYPDDTTFRRLDLTRDVGLEVLEQQYNPLWNELRFGA